MKKHLTTTILLTFLGWSIYLPINPAKAETNFQNTDGGTTAELGILRQQTAPVLFLENKGQMIDDQGALVPQVLFKAKGNGIDFYLTNKGLTYVFYKIDEVEDPTPDALETDPNSVTDPVRPTINKFRLDMELIGANINAEVIKENPTGFRANYYLSHCPQGITGVKEYQRITLKNIYPNIDWVLYSDRNNELSVKYDFVVHPGGGKSVV